MIRHSDTCKAEWSQKVTAGLCDDSPLYRSSRHFTCDDGCRPNDDRRVISGEMTLTEYGRGFLDGLAAIGHNCADSFPTMQIAENRSVTIGNVPENALPILLVPKKAP